jgi:hypothetical protein
MDVLVLSTSGPPGPRDGPDIGKPKFLARLRVEKGRTQALQLFMGGLFPVLTWKGMVAAYLGLFGLVAGGSILASD